VSLFANHWIKIGTSLLLIAILIFVIQGVFATQIWSSMLGATQPNVTYNVVVSGTAFYSPPISPVGQMGTYSLGNFQYSTQKIVFPTIQTQAFGIGNTPQVSVNIQLIQNGHAVGHDTKLLNPFNMFPVFAGQQQQDFNDEFFGVPPGVYTVEYTVFEAGNQGADKSYQIGVGVSSPATPPATCNAGDFWCGISSSIAQIVNALILFGVIAIIILIALILLVWSVLK
jgi:hypothetical protein